MDPWVVEQKDQQERIQKALNQSFEELTNGKDLRKLRAQEFRCQARCFENERVPNSQLENCAMNCATPVREFIQSVNSLYTGVVERMNRCRLQCLDEEKDRMGSTFSNDTQTISFSNEAKACATKCVDDCLNIHFPKIHKEVQKELAAVKIPE